MGVPLEQWIETINAHPAKYLFQGLRGEGDHRARGFFTDVREAAVYDERYMDAYMDCVRKGMREELDAALSSPSDGEFAPPGEDDLHVESYAEFLRNRFWHKWDESENINRAPARKVIALLDPDHSNDLRWEWAYEAVDPQYEWEWIREHEDAEALMREHPPVEMWSHAFEEGVPLDDVWFICPGCGREPIREDGNECGYCCGLCGASSNAPTMEAFFRALEVKEWPFRERDGEGKHAGEEESHG